jgi:hypothetical protein
LKYVNIETICPIKVGLMGGKKCIAQYGCGGPPWVVHIFELHVLEVIP